MKLTTFKARHCEYLHINLLFCSLINLKHIFHASHENFCSFMQQIAYIVLYIIFLEEYKFRFLTKCLYLELNSQRPLRTPESISCIFFNLKGLGRRTLTELFLECRLNFNMILSDPKIG